MKQIKLGGMPLYDPRIQSRAITEENKTGATKALKTPPKTPPTEIQR